MKMKISYVVVQAGGRGSRLQEYTENKPKAIVSVNNLPIIYHLFRKFPEKKFIIIGDYRRDVLEKYLDTFPEVEHIVVDAEGKKGTCGGISKALTIIPHGEPFILIWSDLILGRDYELPVEEGNYVGLSGTFSCRWMYDGKDFIEKKSEEKGVAGFFIFKDKRELEGVPSSGEFVKWLSQTNHDFKTTVLSSTAEYGLVEKIEKPKSGRCRPFNTMKVENGRLIKIGIDEQGRKLAVREKAWYKHVSGMDVAIPKIYSYEPLVLELVSGKNVYEYSFSEREKSETLKRIMKSLKELHSFDICEPDRFSMKEAYFDKTVSRLEKVRNLIPFSNDPVIEVNGKKCRNIFFHLDELRCHIAELPCDHFCLIHGDCTFSNIILRDGITPVFIDPRGYFGKSEIVGDPNYDWAKLFYSVVGDYDQFNLGRFKLSIERDKVKLSIETNGWRGMEKIFKEELPENVSMKDIRFIHALIWLSLTTYAWNDYDSVCGAFYNGLYYLEDSL